LNDAKKAWFLPQTRNRPKPLVPNEYFIGWVTFAWTSNATESRVPNEYRWHAKVFSEQESQWLLQHTIWDHAIELLPGALNTLPGQLLLLMQEEIEEAHKFVKDHLVRNTIRPLWSPYAANFFFVKKKDGKLQLVQDYRPQGGWVVQWYCSPPGYVWWVTIEADGPWSGGGTWVQAPMGAPARTSLPQ
jgi:hypothetical protein